MDNFKPFKYLYQFLSIKYPNCALYLPSSLLITELCESWTQKAMSQREIKQEN